jgi:hypothetical protein
MGGKGDTTNLPLETLVIRPRKTDIDIRLVCLVWVPES